MKGTTLLGLGALGAGAVYLYNRSPTAQATARDIKSDIDKNARDLKADIKDDLNRRKD